VPPDVNKTSPALFNNEVDVLIPKLSNVDVKASLTPITLDLVNKSVVLLFNSSKVI